MKHLIKFFRKCKLLIMLLSTVFFVNAGFGQGQVINPTSPWTVPAGVTSIKVEVWGGGGGGGAVRSSTFGTNGGGGGGGGAYNASTFSVTPGHTFTITVGAGGTKGNGGAGGTGGTTIVSGMDGTVSATGGGGGGYGNNGNGSAGAASTGGVRNGGKGGASSQDGAGGGGGAGNNGDGQPGGDATTGSGGAGNPNNAPYIGGSGGAFITSDGGGNSGVAPGGGGGGGRGTGFFSRTSNDGGIGGGGQVVISYTCPTATISYSSPGFCTSITSAAATINGSTGGTFSVIPSSGLTINSSGVINPSTSTAGTYTVHYQFAGGNSCSAIDATATVNINPLPVAAVPNQTNISCYGGADGTITVSAGAGSSPYTFSIDNGTNYLPATGINLRQFTGLLANTAYTIKVKDANGCISN